MGTKQMSREKSACEKVNVILCSLKNIFCFCFWKKKECAPEICWISYLSWSESDFPPGFRKKEETTKVTINPSFKKGNGRDCMLWCVWKVSWNKQATVHLPHRDKNVLAVANKRKKSASYILSPPFENHNFLSRLPPTVHNYFLELPIQFFVDFPPLPN